ncbi:immunoglobulin-binding protein 1 [Hoplias malabaricus]|uniref:immunoglobulin-binding protein 1 n=1 Tax=Hoplias malabaricus TaxID=27720 RepID=UPI003461C884
MAGVEEGAETPRLSELLDGGRKLLDEVENTTEPCNSNAVQVKVKRGIKQLQEALNMLEQLQLFSRNEDVDEVATTDLKYLLMPALLAMLTLKQTNPAQRLEHVQKAQELFLAFLRRCKDYGIGSFSMPSDNTEAETTPTGEGPDCTGPSPRPQQPDLITMARERQAKIERYKQRKDAESKLAELRVTVDEGLADDETLREFYLLQVNRWISVAIEEISSINQEISILKRMEGFKQTPAQPPFSRPPMKPFILTKDAVQAKVFGAGYPSLPTMTVDDWYDQHRRKGCFPDQGIHQSTADVDAEAREKERREEEDDEEALQKARDWDNWKDTHRRGFGNRKNMG